mgnify:CR=1 FL=1
MSQSSLLKSKNFLPFFSTQFLGAFNDNIFKNTLMLMLTYNVSESLGMNTLLVLNLAAVLFILPFLLFSSIAGQVTDKYEKSSLIRKIKLIEIVIMLGAAVGLIFEQYYLLLFLLFLMGAQSSFFGPAKYAILPQHLKPEELVGGNALVQMGTFVSILLATIGAGIIMQFDANLIITATMVVGLAILGYLSSRSIPYGAPSDSQLKISFNPISTSFALISKTRETRSIFLAIMAISWFWFLGASYLTQFPSFSKDVLHGDASLVTLLLAVFSIGIGFGSMLCEKLSGQHVELGIVPLGALGMTLFGIDLYFAIPDRPDTAISWLMFLNEAANWRLLIDLAGIGISGGIFIVPLNAFVQFRSEEKYRARTIAVINIMNAVFLVASGLIGMLFLGILDLTIVDFFLVLAIMNLVVSAYIFYQINEFVARFIVWVLSHTIYRVNVKDLYNIPKTGPAVLVCNHVSYVDALLIAGTCPRPIRFVMDHNIFKSPFMGWFFRIVNAIPIAPIHQNEQTYHQAFDSVSSALKNDELVCIFPEGKLTKTGEMNPFKSGIETIIRRDAVPVIPLALQGLWGSYFSHKGGTAFTTAPKRFWSKVNVLASEAILPENVSAQGLQDRVQGLRDSAS